MLMLATIEFNTSNKDVIYKALKPDVEQDAYAEIDYNDCVRIVIHANKISDLRAKVNSYLRLYKSCSRCLDLK